MQSVVGIFVNIIESKIETGTDYLIFKDIP